MKNIRKKITLLTLAVFGLCSVSSVEAQVNIPEKNATVILFPSVTKTVGYKAQTILLDVIANAEYTITSDASWLSAKKEGKYVHLKVEQNFSSTAREGVLSFKAGSVTKTLTVLQSRDGTAEYVATDNSIVPTGAMDNNHQSGQPASNTIDGNFDTKYHTTWGVGNVTEENPAILTYSFSGNNHIDYINYIPSGGNGDFGKLDIYYKLDGGSDYVLLGNYDFAYSNTATQVSLTEAGLDNVVNIKMVVKSGENNFASCAEMQFFQTVALDNQYKVFTDMSLSALAPSVDQSVVDTLTNPFVKTLAQRMLDGNYDTKYRVTEFSCLLSPESLSSQWSTPGKLYDQIQGVTGIMMTPGKAVVAVSGVPDGKTISLRVIGWDKSEEYAASVAAGDKSPSGGGPTEESYALKNGTNIINRTSSKNALAYIAYYDSENPDAYGDVKVHFVNGVVNGYLSPDKSNNEMHQILNNAPYKCIDCFGSKVHSIWTVDGLIAYAKDKDGNVAYRQYLNVLDTLIAWEHRLLGLEKYNRIPKNKTMAYVNYSYYMFQGSFGVSFMFNTQSRCVSPKNIMYNDDDVVWGLSHEWGHQHQMQPYFCWAGLSESSNNMNSCYNVLHMGYAGSRILNGWKTARQLYLNDEQVKDGYGKGTISDKRKAAYEDASSSNSSWGWNAKLQAKALEMKDAYVYAQADSVDRAVSINECYVEQNLAPFFMLHTYFSQTGLPDYSPDMYESLRLTDTGDDKYELIAGAQNGKSGRYAALAAAYPNSCWVKDKFVSENSTTWQNSVPYIFNYVRKASKLTGYNLYPYFEKWGFFRLVALKIDDYGNKYYCMTKEMKDEFKADMDALNLKVMPETLVDEISTIAIPRFSTPNIPN